MNLLQLSQHTVVRKVQLRKYRKGWVGHKASLVHLRNDIPCGFELCPEHNRQKKVFPQDPLSNDTIYFIDTYTLINNTDIVYNCQQLENLIILQSSVQKLKNYNPTAKNQGLNKKHSLNVNKYNAFKNFIESVQANYQLQKEVGQDQKNPCRKVYILADKYHKGIQDMESISNYKSDKIVDESLQKEQAKERKLTKNQENQKQSQLSLFGKVIKWYQGHVQDINLKGVNFSLITSDETILKETKKIPCEVISLVSFLRKQNSNLLDFVGFEELKQINQRVKIPLFAQQKFQPHLQQFEYMQRIREGKLFEGKFMADKSYFKLGGKMFKLDLQNNRALFGDIVVIQLADKALWRKKFKKLDLEDQQDESTFKQSTQQPVNVDKNLISFLEENPDIVPKGKIVAIHKRNLKSYCGSLDSEKILYSFAVTHNAMKDESQESNDPSFEIYKFFPVDNRFPNFYMRSFNVQALKKKRIQVQFDDWPEYSEFPLCHYVRTIGNEGNSKAEGDIILLEHNVEIKEFSKKAYDCLPEAGEKFTIPQQQLAYRLDLRHIDVVSIDPPGCKDIDDALHCTELPNGNYQIGVHIADVSYYVRPDSALDMEARNRCTTVYLVDRRTDMLPKLLTENLCSLRSNVDRLAFSVIWQIDRDANIINSKYCKTIIRSRHAFTYMQAQELKDSQDQGNVANSIRNLNTIAQKLKKRRNQKGALTLASTQVKIKLAEETNSATDVQLYEMVQTNYLIEEFMLLANISVAQKIYERFPSISILRRHTQPKMNELQTLKEIFKQYGYEFSFNSSKDLAQSLDKITRNNDSFFNKLVRIMTTRCMNEATYFCSADFDVQEFHHYGLATDFYTHFTSPIRRYADVLVHRLLAAAIDLQPLPSFMINKIKMTKVCEKMNMRNRMARYASRASSDYHTYQFFKDRDVVEKANVTSITQEYMVLMLIKFGIESRIQFTQEEQKEIKGLNKNAKFIKEARIGGKTIRLFDYVDVKVKVQLQGFHKKMILKVL